MCVCVCVFQPGETILQAAVENDQEEMLKFLVEECGAADQINQLLWVRSFFPVHCFWLVAYFFVFVFVFFWFVFWGTGGFVNYLSPLCFVFFFSLSVFRFLVFISSCPFLCVNLCTSDGYAYCCDCASDELACLFVFKESTANRRCP